MGSLCFLISPQMCGGSEGVLFTGDHFAFSGRLGRLDGFGRYGNDLKLQAQSISTLAPLPFRWVLPGHGRRFHFISDEERRRRVMQVHALMV
jgi:glyoxylase-like metal-dependent hydrolase (beta-lactamase superfamily II)